ncbi:MAG: hypothetical protein Q8928_00890 [Bacteroidota bacterium]|nr:hypothetical protein [Bacteroidota bacterium]
MSKCLIINKVILTSVFIVCATYPLYAGNENYPAGARSAALSNASVALTDVWSTFNNQAGLSWLPSPVVSVYFENRFQVKEFSMRAAAFAFPVKPGCIAVSYRSFGYSVFNESKFGLTYSLKISKHFSAAAQVDYLQSYFGNGYGDYHTVAGEVGIMAEPLTNLWIGFHVFNPTQTKKDAIEEEKIPTVVRLGICYRVGEKAGLMFETEKDISQKPVFKGGVEVGVIENLNFRAGYRSGYEQYSLGMGYKFKGVIADLAFSRHQILGFSPQVSLGYEF